MAADMAASFRWTSLWPAVFALVLVVVPAAGKWPGDFPTLRFPTALIEKHEDRIRGKRVLTTDEWADYFLYRFYPVQRVYFDGRTDFYGPSVGKEYIRLVGGGHDWAKSLEKHGFEAALLPPDVALTSLLKQDKGWRVAADNGKAVLFLKTARDISLGVALMNSVPSSELSMRERDVPDSKARR